MDGQQDYQLPGTPIRQPRDQSTAFSTKNMEDQGSVTNKDALFISEPSTSQIKYQQHVGNFIEELGINQEVNKSMNLSVRTDNMGSNIHESASVKEQNTTSFKGKNYNKNAEIAYCED